jgi:predicted GNAT family N-acyltransferase
MCFVWISEQRAVISLYSINWVVFVTETECVYCAVGAESLDITQVNFRLESIKAFSRLLCSGCGAPHVSTAARHAVHRTLREYNTHDKISFKQNRDTNTHYMQEFTEISLTRYTLQPQTIQRDPRLAWRVKLLPSRQRPSSSYIVFNTHVRTPTMLICLN